ncbi:MFS transporter [Streptomyces sp. NA04227]|uniref:MFS transporter n=1 Tax=Streptomyces sp. NA04227 TaxID=2742136 RepID=UPI0015909A0D|nr:MFS transporter [Streptomyces sp. NA04227]QKW09350.1 MFS transporter [Streptomyces sp. NA04227]
MNLLKYIGARAVSQLGDAMLPVALTFGVLQAGYGATGVGLVLAAHLFPFVALLLLGGVLADHLHPKPVLLAADAVRVVSMGFMAVQFASGEPVLWQLVVAQAVTGTAGAMFEPGSKGLVPHVAPGRVREGYAYLRISESVVTLAGPALAGLLLAFVGPAVVIAVDCASYLLSCVLIALVKLPARPPAKGRPRITADLREGWRELRARTWLWVVIGSFGLLGLFLWGPYQVLVPTILIEDHDATTYGLLQAVFGAGAVCGGFVGLRREPRRPLYVGALAMIAFVPQLWLIATGAPVAIIGIAMFAAGAGRAFWGVMWSTSVQSQVPPGALNRISAYEVMGSMLLLPVGSTLAGPASTAFGTTAVLVAAGCAGLLAFASLVAVPAVRGLTSGTAGRTVTGSSVVPESETATVRE